MRLRIYIFILSFISLVANHVKLNGQEVSNRTSFRNRFLEQFISNTNSLNLTGNRSTISIIMSSLQATQSQKKPKVNRSKIEFETQKSSLDHKSITGRIISPRGAISKIDGLVREEWIRTYASNLLSSDDFSNSIAVDNYGNVIITGVSFTSYSGADFFTLKYNERGDTLWTRRFNGKANGYDEAIGVVADDIGNVYVTGYSATDIYHYALVTIQYKNNGEVGWIATYSPTSDSNDIPTCIEINHNGEIYIGGYKESNGDADILVIKYDHYGNLLWDKAYDGGQYGLDIAFALAIDSSGGALIGGASQNHESGSDMTVVSYDSSGAFRWINRNPQQSNKRDAVTSIVIDIEGSAYVTGYHADLSGSYDYLTAKYNINGELIWSTPYNGDGNGNDFAISIGLDQNNNIYVTGSSYGGFTGDDFLTISYDNNGIMRWKMPYKGSAGYDDRVSSLILDRIHNQLFVSGLLNSRSGGAGDYATIRYSYNGFVLGMMFYDNQSNANDSPSAMACDGKGNVYVTGSSNGGSTSYDYLTVKYKTVELDQWPTRFNNGNGSNIISFLEQDSNGNIIAAGNDSSKMLVIKFDSTGKLKWQTSFGNARSKMNGLVIDSADNIYVTGSSYNGISMDYVTIKYDSHGSILWNAQYDGPSAQDDKPSGISVASTGDVYVTGASYGNGTMSDIATIKYDSQGVEQWIARYNGSLNNRDSASGIVLDSSGNAFVAGTTVRNGSSYDFIIIKYTDAGLEVWKTFYNGTANGADFAKSIITDNKGFVYVTGRSNGKATYGDYATLKISYTGIIQWAARFDGPESGIDDPVSIGVDNQNNVIVTGLTYSSTTGNNIATVKYNQNGYQLWSQIFNGDGSGNDYTAMMKIDMEGNSYITGTITTSSSGLDMITLRYSPAGFMDWHVRYNSYYNLNDEAKCLTLDIINGFIYMGGVSNASNSYTDIVISKNTLGGSSDQLWPRRENGPGISFDDARMLKISTEGDAVIVGKSLTSSGNEDLLLCSYKTNGNLNWNILEKNSSGGDINISDMVIDKTGRINLSGTNYNSYSPCDVGVYQYNTDGGALWQQRFDGVTHSYDFGSSVAVDESSNVIVAGYSSGSISYDYVINKYNLSGQHLWTVNYDGESMLDDLAYSVAVDKENNIYVTGLSVSSTGKSDYLTLKLTSDGKTKWSTRWNGSLNADDRAITIATDSAYNVYVCGYSTGNDTTYDIVMVKYDSSGNQLFAVQYIGPPHTDQIVDAMCVDFDGNAVIAGHTNEQGLDNSDYLILKYNPYGNLVFDKLYDGPAGKNDKPNAVTIDRMGAVYVTGKSIGEDMTYDFATIKLNSVGEIVWTARYSSAIGCNDEAKSIQIDTAGNVYITGTSYTNNWSVIASVKYSKSIVGVTESEPVEPKQFKLFQNYPNPFNPSTSIKFSLPKSEHVKIQIFNIMGQSVQTILDCEEQAGTHEIKFEVSDLSSGIYFYRLQTKSGYLSTKKMIILR
jgi:uncharacterized delta-60 repeat protein